MMDAPMKNFAALALALALPSVASAQSVWMHNRSEMLLETDDSGIVAISYLVPRKGLSAFPGSVVFNGVILGEKVIGRATLFSAKCGEIGYDVRGSISPDKRTIRLSGMAPIRNDQCKPVRVREDRLEFTYDRAAASIDPNLVGEWSSYSESCDEEGAQQGPILHSIARTSFSGYETYCAFVKVTGTRPSTSVDANCRIMDSTQRMKLSFTRVANQTLDLRMTGGEGGEVAPVRLYKCPISAADIARVESEKAKKAEQDEIAAAREKAHSEGR